MIFPLFSFFTELSFVHTPPPKKKGREAEIEGKKKNRNRIEHTPCNLQARLRCSLGSALCVLRVVVQLLLPHALPAGREEEAHPNVEFAVQRFVVPTSLYVNDMDASALCLFP